MKPDSIITSKANPRFKAIQKQLVPSGTKRTHTLLLGEKLIEAWHASQNHPLRAERWLQLESTQNHPLQRNLKLPIFFLSESLMRSLADAGSPPRHALLMGLEPERAGPLASRVLIPWGIQDPGNLGAMLRGAAACGFHEALLGPGCADPFSPKALRGSMGAAFLLTIRRCETLALDDGHWFALDSGPEAKSLSHIQWREPLRILVGNEGHGWQKEALPPEVMRVNIPTTNVESLNAAVAAGIACWEVQRRRSQAFGP